VRRRRDLVIRPGLPYRGPELAGAADEQDAL
jgi:hypothetical protein